jgi:hypothetical protein
LFSYPIRLVLSHTHTHTHTRARTQVRDWANGQADDIGELQVVPGTLGTGYDTAAALAGARGGSAGAAAAAAQDAAPFYQQLGQHAQYLEVRLVVEVIGARCGVTVHGRK